MPTLEVQDYEHFSFDDRPLTLDEAVQKASELRKNDAVNFYRIEPANEANTSFKITKVRAASVYADFVARMCKLMAHRSSIHTTGK
jgi:hypothetical protein